MNLYHKLEKYEHKKMNNTHKIYNIKYKFYKNMMGGFTSINKIYIRALNDFIKEHNKTVDSAKQIDDSHGVYHTLMVLCHTEKALNAYKKQDDISEIDILKVKLAALLHDIDDSKYFENNTEYQNARIILENTHTLSPDNINDIIKMISWVSASKNGDNIPDECIGKEYMLYPRYADRLEAIGIIGVERTLEYTLHKNQPLCIPKDSNPKITIEQIYDDIATEERYKKYTGKSISMMDHFYDKLLRLGKYPIRNKYFDDECAKRQKPLEDIALLYEKQGYIKEEEVREYIEKNKSISTTCECNDEVSKFSFL
jgi:uncharacterized protein